LLLDTDVVRSTVLRRLVAAQEEERRRISRDLHDELGQTLTALRMSLVTTLATATSAEMRANMTCGIALVDQAIVDMRRVASALRLGIVDDLGLVAALRGLAARAHIEGSRAVEFSFEGVMGRLGAEIETASYRIAQEALTNIARHSDARNVRVSLQSRRGRLRLVVEDDGVGFSVQAASIRAKRRQSLGIIGMRERADAAGGRLRIISNRGGPTRIEADFPTAGSPVSRIEADFPTAGSPVSRLEGGVAS
jgi:signal transduction histidine kinase